MSLSNKRLKKKKHCYWAVLSQLEDVKERPIAYLSRTLSKAEEKYSATAKELLAKRFRPYLYGRPFVIYTDHEPLTKELKLTDATSNHIVQDLAVDVSQLNLEQYDFKIIYKKGKQNKVADGLSRIPPGELNMHELSNECFDNDEIYGPEIVNKFQNQIIIRVSNDPSKSSHIICKIFPGQVCHVFHQDPYTKENLTDILKKYINPSTSNGIFAPAGIIRTCDEMQHFSKRLKFHYSNILLPDIILGTDQQNAITLITETINWHTRKQ